MEKLLKSPAQLRQLRAATTADLKKADSQLEGLYIVATIASTPPRASPADILQLDIVTEDGEAATLTVAHVICVDLSLEEVAPMFPAGARVAIQEPSTRRKNKRLLVMVFNPQAVQVLDYFPKLACSDPGQLREMGNQKFKAKSFYEAADLYGRSISSAKERGGEGDEQNVLVGFSNRAEAKLKLGQWEGALADANAALACSPQHSKSLSRKARALLGLCQYTAGVEALKQALLSDPGNQELRKSHEEALALAEQSTTGVYKLSAYIKSGCSQKNPPKLADFLGPVEMKTSSIPKAGRGLFVTRDVKRGELLLVCNAVAATRSKMMTEYKPDLTTAVTRACINSSRVHRQVLQLAQTLRCHGLGVSSMDVFRPNLPLEDPKLPLDIDINSIKGAVACNLDVIRADAEPDETFGLFVLPSFVNHACFPTVAFFTVGNAQMVIAARELRAGEEMLRSYFNCLEFTEFCSPTQMRAFQCERCVIKTDKSRKSFDAKFVSALRRYESVAQGSSDRELQEAGEMLVSLALELEWMMNKQKLSEEVKAKLRCVYVFLYRSNFGDKFKEVPWEKMMEGLLQYSAGVRRSFSFNVSFYRMMMLEGLDTTRAYEILREHCHARMGVQPDDVVASVISQHLQLTYKSW